MKNRLAPLLTALALASAASSGFAQGGAVFVPLPPSGPAQTAPTEARAPAVRPEQAPPARRDALREPASLHGVQIGMSPQEAIQALSQQPGLSAPGAASGPEMPPRQEQLLVFLQEHCSSLSAAPTDGTASSRPSCMFVIQGSPPPAPESLPEDASRADRIQVTLEFRDTVAGPSLSAALFCAMSGPGRSVDWALDEFSRQAGFSGLAQDISEDSKLLLRGAATTFCPVAAPDAGASAKNWNAWIETDEARGDKATHAALRGLGARGLFDMAAWFETLEEPPTPQDPPPAPASPSPTSAAASLAAAPKP